MDNQSNNQKNNGGYGAWPLWKWIILCVVVGGVAYGFVYYFVLHKAGGGYKQNANTPYVVPTQNQPITNPYSSTPSPIPTPPASATTNPAPKSETLTPTAKNFTVHANDASADLTAITVAKGTLVHLTFSVDVTGTYHGGLDFRSSMVSTGAISPGSSKTISFTADNSFAFTPYWPSTNTQKPYTISVVVQ